MPCISGKRDFCKSRKLWRWALSLYLCVCVFVCVCVCLCVCVFVCVCVCPSLHCGFASRSVLEVWPSLCMTHMKQNPMDATDSSLTVRLKTWDATATREAVLWTQLPHVKQSYGRKCYRSLTVRLKTWCANDTHEADTLRRNWHAFLTARCSCYIHLQKWIQGASVTATASFHSIKC
jgi:hypothetical protein